MIKLVQWLILCLVIGESVHLGKSNSEESERVETWMDNVEGKDDLILIRIERDLIEDDCADDTKTMVAESIACSKE